jgi:hypothetical protein
MTNKYTIERIFNECEFVTSMMWTETFRIKLKIPCQALNTELFLSIHSIPSHHMTSVIYQRIEQTANAILFMEKELVDEIHSELWRMYLEFCENCQHPLDEDGDNAELNKKHYEIWTIEEMIKKTTFKWASTRMSEYQRKNDAFSFSLDVTAEWIGEGYVEFFISNNKIVYSDFHQ